MAAKLTKLQRTMMMCLMLLVAQVGFAEERVGTTLVYDFNWYHNNLTPTQDRNFTTGEPVNNSVGENMILLSGLGGIGTRFAVGELTGNSNNRWYVRDNGNSSYLYSYWSGYRRLSIMGLSAGHTVQIFFENVSESNTINIRSNNVTGKNGVKDLTNQAPTGSAITSEEVLTMSKSGSLDLWVGRYIAINKVVINDGGRTNHVSFETTSGMSHDDTHGYYYKSQLSARDFVEPKVSVYPSTANVYYSVENWFESTRTGEKEVAVMNENPAKKDDVLFKNIGWCKVTASIDVGGTTYSDSYIVWIWDNLAEYVLEDNGTKYRLSGAGVLENRVVTAIPGMTMTFGIPDKYPTPITSYNDVDGSFNYNTPNTDYNYQPNSVIVSVAPTPNDDKFISFISADNGWWDRFPYRADRYPYQGTFYTFKAKASGTLTVGGYRSAAYEVMWKNKDNPTGNTGSILSNDQGQSLVISKSKDIVMTAGQTYIIHGVTPHIETDDYWNTATGWAVFELEWFKFESDFKIIDPATPSMEKLYGVASECGATSVTSREIITLKNISDISSAVSVKNGSISLKGTITGASVTINSDGTMTFSNITYSTNAANKKGGAIKVTLVNGENEKDFVMTIPYGKHVWDFRCTAEQSETRPADISYDYSGLTTMMKANGSDWNRVFKVSSKNSGGWTNLIDPLMVARGSINGNNAFYMDNTAGLMFITGSESFGSFEISNNIADYNTLTNDQKYRQPYTIITGTDLVWMKGQATIYFPGVKAGQYIKIYTYRHAVGKGETFTAKNLIDLDNVEYDGTTSFILRGMWDDRYPGYKGDNIKGCAIFKVPRNATQNCAELPQITLCDNGWLKIYRIEIMDEYEPDLIMTDDNGGTFYPVDYDGKFSSVVLRKKNNTLSSETRTYLATTGQTRCQHANTCDYEVIADAGIVNVARTIWNSKTDGTGVNYNKLELTFNKAGKIRIIQRERANTTGDGVSTAVPNSALGYVIDKNEYYINVGELTVQDYPFTWDFTSHNMYQGSSATETNLGTGTSNWTKSEHTYTQIAIGSAGFGSGTGQIPQNLSIPYANFAQGAQLSNATGTAIAETEGLGITAPTTTKEIMYLATVNNIFGEQTREFEGYILSNNSLKIDGAKLEGAGKITIPEVPNGMYIFVSFAEGSPVYGQTKAGETTIDALYQDSDIFGLEGGVYCYLQNSGSTQDVTIPLNNGAKIKEIAITNLIKSINALGYATESRDHAIDHTYQDKFTTHAVKAYAITTYGGTGDTYNYKGYPEVRKSLPLTVVPANTGIVLCQENYSANATFSSPLFYPAVNVIPTNDDESILANNWMAPNVVSKQHYSETIAFDHAMKGDAYHGQGIGCTKFIMTRKYYTYNKNEGTSTEHSESTNVEAFYRMKINTTDGSRNVIGANKAYLLIPTEKLPKALWDEGDGTGTIGKAPAGVIYMDLAGISGEDDETTAIDSIIHEENETINGQDVYYSLSGVRIIGTPTTKGIYIRNGKKVSIK